MSEGEGSIERKIQRIITNKVVKEKDTFILLDKEDVTDIIVCRNMPVPTIFFIEVNHLPHKQGRMGLGHAHGGGFLPGMLLKRPAYFEDHLRWVFQREGDAGYYVLGIDVCKKYMLGELLGDGERVGFNPVLFKEVKPMGEGEFLGWLEVWLSA